ncbi:MULTISPECIES: TetR/AcrR family transcriptional regulator [unclassified Bradyrhizobium]|uniref:TetR/AcrR family transcriptional regulator n=1 Tax=unclassified Bradyrhizobium TaxID=2631580 RepID=UPI001FF7CF46|nr:MULTISPECIES: TetR/AcrR family transcriptional regulator [unclassified Bradyrhizobium]MCK1267606.1 TetR/AcrR family transcriptional regulator [Bradyrhizobium sp. 84]MCK1374340.1 TetR/AcrR family transcriptional regulator [Bradyrhizobium sp. 49]MCK1413726.1 TetR/AcrR family transcriptional regulator [Bradyrhizobium sp. CW4]MCK1427249.1 TetR/AcrR family transcriptional regulator [Bradyrhizobium sp. 87]MCK1603443.1 TetR/AcrR family transcriptional regulator [Bradyrhizobium sp. 166]
MRVSRVQAAENRKTVINVASRLFRERGFDGIGLKDLMEGAGLTQGAFYKQFASKEDLAVEASRRALESASGRWSDAAAQNPDDPLSAVIGFYLSGDHRGEKMDGCPIVALGSDAARQGPEVKAEFEAGIKAHLDVLDRFLAGAGDEASRSKAMAILATMVGAVTLSRVINDPDLAQAVLDAAAKQVRGAAAA